MNKLFLTELSAALWIAVPGCAQTPVTNQAQPAAVAAPAGPIHMAWLHLEQAIFNTDEGKREFGEVQKFVDKKNAELQALQKEVEILTNQLKIQGEKLTDEARADLEIQLEMKQIHLQRFSQDTQKEIDNLKVRTSNMIGRKMLPVIEKISKQRGYNAVVIRDPSRDLYVDPSLIITEDVIRSYNQMYPETAAKPATPATQKP
jgi:Skp family chaperone for outer membrane proteins